MRYTLNFQKKDYMKYLSHLDLIRLFIRSFKKAGIKLEYSNGYNPHARLKFGQPLPLGVVGLNEIIEIVTLEEYNVEDIKKRLNEQMPNGIEFTTCNIVGHNQKNIAAQITKAEYKIEISNLNLNSQEIDEFLLQDEINVLKKQKKLKEFKKVNIKPLIQKIKYEIVANDNSSGNNFIMYTIFDCGSNSNLNPTVFLEALMDFYKIQISNQNIEITRIKLY